MRGDSDGKALPSIPIDKASSFLVHSWLRSEKLNDMTPHEKSYGGWGPWLFSFARRENLVKVQEKG